MNENDVNMNVDMDEEEDELCSSAKGRKSLAPLFVLEILELNTNSRKQYSQEDILERLDAYPYALAIDRKTLGRDLKLLMKEFPTVRRGSAGVYYDRYAA